MEYDFLSLVRNRQSDRQYINDKAVESDKLERILEAARLAPSACNGQPWRFVVMTDPVITKEVGIATAGLGMNKFAREAPVLILVVEEPTNASAVAGGVVKGKHFPLLDIGIAVSNITLAAQSEGLGSCIMGWFDEKKIKKITGIPRSRKLLLVIAIGYTNGKYREKVRKSKDKIISFNRY
ncbi:MAG TPA: nitroreductase family protein [Bacteroidaceae bacterium]|nr:nitroreductase family protein [Bacteroidaceae bacterium]